MAIKKIVIPWESHPERDNTWYEEQKKRMTKDEVAREIDRSYSPSVTGKIFTSFHERLHLSREPLSWNPHLPVYRIWDFGCVNATLFGQIDNYNRRKLLREVVLGSLEEGSNTPEQIEYILAESQRHYKGAKFIDICDPAGSYRDHRGDNNRAKEIPRTDVEQMQAKGIDPRYETIKDIPAPNRKERSRNLFTMDMERFVGGEPSFLMYANPQGTDGCPRTLEALQGGYRRKKDARGNYREEIHEEHPFEDVIDCILYWYLETASLSNEPDLTSHKPVYPKGNIDPYTGYRM
jgi:hypothetical protein